MNGSSSQASKTSTTSLGSVAGRIVREGSWRVSEDGGGDPIIEIKVDIGPEWSVDSLTLRLMGLLIFRFLLESNGIPSVSFVLIDTATGDGGINSLF